MKVIFDIRGEPQEGDSPTLTELRSRVANRPTDRRAEDLFSCANHTFTFISPVAVTATFGEYGGKENTWLPFLDVPTSLVNVMDRGTDHFPIAGFYENGSVKATVNHSRKHDFAAPGVIEMARLAQAACLYDKTPNITLALTVIDAASWHLDLHAPSFAEAEAAYKAIRTGALTPVAMADALAPAEKIRLVQPEPGTPKDK